MRRLVVVVLIVVSSTFFAAPAVAGDVPAAVRGSISGNVKDALGRPIAEASVQLISSEGKIAGQARTDAQGRFKFSSIPPGNYSVVADKGAFKTARSIAAVTGGGAATVAIAMESEQALDLALVTRRLDKARNSLDPKTGGSAYRFSQKAIEDLPQGANTRFDQVLLQAPGVTQDSFGQLHVRGDHGNLQYRIDGVQIPEGVFLFSQTQSPRFAKSVSLLTGALPAQYGFRTAGVIDIQTKTGAFENGGNLDFYGGQRDTQQPSFELGGHTKRFSYYVTGQYQRNDRAVEPPTSGPTAFNDHLDSGNLFAYLSYVLTPQARVSLISGTSLAEFGIPAARNATPGFTLAGVNDVDPNALPSIDVKEKQIEQNYYNVLSIQGLLGTKFNYQLSAFSRYSSVKFIPDFAGDLIYTGVAANVFRSSFVNGLQGDASYELTDTNTVRAGFYFSGERAEIDNHSAVFPADAAGNQTSTVPFNIVDNAGLTTWLYDGYIQDEWRPNEQWTFNGGLRFDLADDVRRTNQLSPRAAAVYQPWKATTLHAAYARYFTPVPTELVAVKSLTKFIGTTNAPASLEDTTPQPERAHYFDVGMSQQVGRHLTLGADSYFRYSQDIIDEGQFGSALIFTPFNYKRGRIYGIELTSSWTQDDLTAYLNQAFSRAQGTQVTSSQFSFDPAELSYISRRYVNLDHDQTITGSAGLAYHWRKFLFSLSMLNASGLRSGDFNTGNLPTYFQFNAGVAKLFSVCRPDDFQARFDVINLFDHTYLIRDGSGIGVQAAQYGPPLTFYGGLKWNFSFSKQPQSASVR
jgi:outer membrane receptor protein involved in Fe transport